MVQRRKYQRRERTDITAVQLQLDLTDGDFVYRKWGGTQRCRTGDWLVENRGDTYTVDQDVFARTYREVSPGRYVKDASIWAEEATVTGAIQTKEGSTDFVPGDFLVFNDADGQDGYAMTAENFHALYESADS